MKGVKAGGAVLVIAGAVLLTLAYQEHDSLGGRLTNFFTGEPNEKTMGLAALGILALLLGLAGLFRRSGE